MTARFVSIPEQDMAALSEARRWLERRGFRTRQHNRSATPVSYFSVTGVPPLLSASQLRAFAVRQGWPGPIATSHVDRAAV